MAMTSAAHAADPALRVLYIEDNEPAIGYVKRGLGSRGIDVDTIEEVTLQ